MSEMRDRTYIGKPLGRAEGPEKLRGQARYPADLRLPGMLVGRALRSPIALGRIVSLDVSVARDLPGVHAVVTAADLPDVRVGRFLRDLPPLARDEVLFAGQKVAAVAAETRNIADQALSLIEVDYDVYDAPVLDPVDSIAPGAHVLHPEFDTYVGRVEGPREHANVMAVSHWGKGDVEAGFGEADLVIETTHRTQRQHQGYIEPHACLVNITADGQVQLWANSKAPFDLRKQVAEGIGLAIERVTVMPNPIGGDFGGKGGFMDTHAAWALASASGRPVLMTMDYTEELIAGNPRHGGVFTLKTGITKDGRITARSADLLFDSGAFGAFRPGKGVSYGPRCLGPYRMEHAAIRTRMVYTNQVPCGSMRSPGDPQSVFASETHVDVVARRVGMDPLDFRLQNMVREGDASPLGKIWRDPMALQVLEQAAVTSGYRERLKSTPDGRLRGMGFSVCERGTGGGICTARVTVSMSGKVTLSISLRDTGSGFYTMLRQVVGEQLGVPYDEIDIETWNTDALPNDGGVGGARITNAGGNAAFEAAGGVRSQIAGYAANKYGWALDSIDFTGESIGSPGRDGRSLAAVVGEIGEVVSSECNFTAPVIDATVFTAQCAEVAVDPETGDIEVLHFVTCHDVGTILNPLAHQGQVEGGFVQGLGYALMEEVLIEDGYVLNAHLGDYKLPTMRDIPPLTTVHVRSREDGPAPYGGKGIGEQSVSGVAPAIVNAILDATGKHMSSLPVTAEKMLVALDDEVTD
jgi:carbon-monoxide dehydrogenase large subunit